MATTGVMFNPSTDIPSLDGKVILITGANSGLGKQASLELAKHKPARLLITARSPEKGNEAVAEIRSKVPDATVELLDLDLSSFDSIKTAAMTVLESCPRLDILMLNAGIMGCPPKLTKDGYEVQMGTNHLGHALLLKLLLPLLTKTAQTSPVRIVQMASSAWKHAGPEKIQFDTLKQLEGVTPVNRYVQSKIASMLYPQAFAKHHPQLTMVSVDPGEVTTALFSREPGDAQMAYIQKEVAPSLAKPVEEGVLNQLWAATATSGIGNGLHYEPVGKHTPSGLMLDQELAAKIWDWTEAELQGQSI